jgi:NAD-dependent deacetylase
VLFDEPLPHAYWLAEAEVGQADGLMVLGSSLEVYPVAGLVPTAARAGARLAIVNREPTPFDHLANVLIHAELGTVMSHLAASLQGRV